MDADVQRLAGLPGVSTTMLAGLAALNPTALQLQLLRDAVAVRHFLDLGGRPPERWVIDDEVRARLVRLNPSPQQLHLLRTEGAVRAFVGSSPAPTPPSTAPPEVDPEHDSNPVSALYHLVAPRQPIFQWLPASGADAPFRAEYRVGDVAGIGVGQTKRVAKNRAALELIKGLFP